MYSIFIYFSCKVDKKLTIRILKCTFYVKQQDDTRINYQHQHGRLDDIPYCMDRI